MAAPPIAAITVLVAGALTPGYNSGTRTISRIVVAGAPAAAAVDFAMALVALSCIALAITIPRAGALGRLALVVAAMALTGAALVHLDPASAGTTALHRIFSGIAVIGLTIAPMAFARTYGLISFASGIAELMMLAVGLVLLASSFDAWGIWERDRKSVV